MRHLDNRFDASFFTSPKSSLIALSLMISVQSANAVGQDDIIRRQQERLIQQEQRQQRLQQQNLPPHTQKPISTQSSPATDSGFIFNEQPCWAIKDIQLVDENGKNAKKFNFALRYAQKKSGFKSGMCLGETSISHFIALMQNKIIDKGYTTTQVGLMPQDLSSGSLKITVITGLVGDIRYNRPELAAFNNKIPLSTGQIFNLRDLETGLENLQRVPTANADIQITPSQMVNASDIVVDYQQSIP
ncbi:MAG: ShlB/FhaC/HecB family hemolysin secretion/activation protein, partial [Neisseriaceae bacterium]|nr:ShlB/FhaC/HecB family hemolysin secretion/activation protein [Neisseriaceae bacterium]